MVHVNSISSFWQTFSSAVEASPSLILVALIPEIEGFLWYITFVVWDIEQPFTSIISLIGVVICPPARMLWE